MIKRKIYMT